MQAENHPTAQAKPRLEPQWRQAPWWIKAGAQTALSLLPFGKPSIIGFKFGTGSTRILSGPSMPTSSTCAISSRRPLDAVSSFKARTYLKWETHGFPPCLFDHCTTMDPSITRVNFLKYSDFAWRIIGQNRIYFHNPLRESEFLLLFREAGFEIVDRRSEVDERSLEALETMRLNPRFSKFDKRDLATYGAIITARKTVPSKS